MSNDYLYNYWYNLWHPNEYNEIFKEIQSIVNNNNNRIMTQNELLHILLQYKMSSDAIEFSWGYIKLYY